MTIMNLNNMLYRAASHDGNTGLIYADPDGYDTRESYGALLLIMSFLKGTL